ncbi:MAG: hypothetical protein HXX16_19805 [Bacteroidales bacterium]|nr:hypothetical protein [Bacteroidales bacterium]
MIKRNSDLIILLIIWIVSIYSVIYGILNSNEFGIQNYIGYGLLIGLSIIRYFKFRKFKTILGIVLVFGSINAIQFTYATMTLVFSWKPFGNSFSSFGIQPLSIVLLLFLVLINYSEFRNLLAENFTDDPNETIERQKRIVEKYYEELKSEKYIKLQEIVDNKKMYRIEYVIAARKLLEERRNKQ